MATQNICLQAGAVLLACAAICCRVQGEELDAARLLAASGWKPGSPANGLFVGPGAVEAAITAGKVKGVRAFLIAEKGPALEKARSVVDAAALYGVSVFVRAASLRDTTFPDSFFHRTVLLGGATDANKKELWRVTRPGGKLLLGPEAGGLTFEGAVGPQLLEMGASKWVAVARPVQGAEWPMKGCAFCKTEAIPSYCSPDNAIKPPLKLLWTTTSGSAVAIVAGGKVYGGGIRDAYTGESLPCDLKGALQAAWQNTVLVERDKSLFALHSETLEEKWKWRIPAGCKFIGVTEELVVCEGPKTPLAPDLPGAEGDPKKPPGSLVFLEKATGRAVAGPALRATAFSGFAVAPDGSQYKREDCHAAGGRPYYYRKTAGETWQKWFNLGGMHGCSPPVFANGYIWHMLGAQGVGGFDATKPGEEAKRLGWYHHVSAWTCSGLVVAYGNLYHQNRGDGSIHCFASGAPRPEQTESGAEEAIERGEAPVAGSREYDLQDWPMFHYDPARTGNSPDKMLQTPLAISWSVPTGGPVRSSPAVAGQTVYVGSCDGKFYAMDAGTGRIRWTFFTEDEILCSPCVWSGMVYFGSDDGWIYCLNADSGRLIWRRAIGHRRPETVSLCNNVPLDFPIDYRWRVETSDGGQCSAQLCVDGKPKRGPWVVRGSPLVVDGRLYIGTGFGNSVNQSPAFWGCLYCLDARTGELLWRRKQGAGVDYAPAYARGTVFAFAGLLEAIDARTGACRSFTNPYLFDRYTVSSSQIALAADKAFIVADTGNKDGSRTVSISLIDGAVIGVGEGLSTSPPFGAPCAVIAEGLAYCADSGGAGRVYSAAGFEFRLGGHQFHLTLPCKKTFKGGSTSSPAYANGRLFCAGSDTLNVLDAVSGDNLCSVKLGGAVRSSPAVSRGKVYVGADDGKLYCLSSK